MGVSRVQLAGCTSTWVRMILLQRTCVLWDASTYLGWSSGAIDMSMFEAIASVFGGLLAPTALLYTMLVNTGPTS